MSLRKHGTEKWMKIPLWIDIPSLYEIYFQCQHLSGEGCGMTAKLQNYVNCVRKIPSHPVDKWIKKEKGQRVSFGAWTSKVLGNREEATPRQSKDKLHTPSHACLKSNTDFGDSVRAGMPPNRSYTRMVIWQNQSGLFKRSEDLLCHYESWLESKL